MYGPLRRLGERGSVLGRRSEYAFLISRQAGREVVIAGGQGPERVRVVGEDDKGIDAERTCPPDGAHRLAQDVDMPHQHIRAQIRGDDGEEPAPAGYAQSPIIRHGAGSCRAKVKITCMP
ncbi:MAG: hypothetical protein IPK66_16570 [Rhodospirillales bacterium]|nr:hypothetical protein [Rhodospirillales bacterium]